MPERNVNSDESEARLLRDLFDNAPDGILLVAPSGKIVLANPEAERLLGYETGTLVGVAIESLLVPEQRQQHTRLRAEYQEAPRRRAMGQGATLRAQRRDGTIVAVDVSLGPSSYRGQPATLAIVRDASARVAAEHRLREAQKLDAIGRLAGGVAHDFNNMMSIILSHSEMLSRELPVDDPARKDVEAIASTAERAANLTRQLLAFARKQILQPEPVDDVQGLLPCRPQPVEPCARQGPSAGGADGQ